jgi:hypothetical protein
MGGGCTATDMSIDGSELFNYVCAGDFNDKSCDGWV